MLYYVKNTRNKKQDATKHVTLFSCVRLSGIGCSMYSLRRDSASRTYFWILPPSLSEEFYVTFLCYWESYLLNLKLKILQADKPSLASGMHVCSLDAYSVAPNRPTMGSRASFVQSIWCHGSRDFRLHPLLEGTEVPKVSFQRRQMKMTEKDFRISREPGSMVKEGWQLTEQTAA